MSKYFRIFVRLIMRGCIVLGIHEHKTPNM